MKKLRIRHAWMKLPSIQVISTLALFSFPVFGNGVELGTRQTTANGPLFPPGSDGTGMYVGVVDGTTPYGSVIKWGETNLFDTPPTVTADPDRRSLTTTLASPTSFVNEF